MRLRPPQRSEDEKSITASAVIIPHTAKPRTNPLKTITDAAVRGRSGPDKALAAVGAYLRVSGPQGRLRACTKQLTTAPPTAMKKNSYNTHH